MEATVPMDLSVGPSGKVKQFSARETEKFLEYRVEQLEYDKKMKERDVKVLEIKLTQEIIDIKESLNHVASEVANAHQRVDDHDKEMKQLDLQRQLLWARLDELRVQTPLKKTMVNRAKLPIPQDTTMLRSILYKDGVQIPNFGTESEQTLICGKDIAQIPNPDYKRGQISTLENDQARMLSCTKVRVWIPIADNEMVHIPNPVLDNRNLEASVNTTEIAAKAISVERTEINAEQGDAIHAVEQEDAIHALEQEDAIHALEPGDTIHAVEQGDAIHAVEQDDAIYALEQEDAIHALEQEDAIHALEPGDTIHAVEQGDAIHAVEQHDAIHAVELGDEIHAVDVGDRGDQIYAVDQDSGSSVHKVTSTNKPSVNSTFSCEICSREFTKQRSLRMHIEWHKIHTRRRRRRRRGLIHKDVRLLKCKHCKKQFKYAKSCETHEFQCTSSMKGNKQSVTVDSYDEGIPPTTNLQCIFPDSGVDNLDADHVVISALDSSDSQMEKDDEIQAPINQFPQKSNKESSSLSNKKEQWNCIFCQKEFSYSKVWRSRHESRCPSRNPSNTNAIGVDLTVESTQAHKVHASPSFSNKKEQWRCIYCQKGFAYSKGWRNRHELHCPSRNVSNDNGISADLSVKSGYASSLEHGRNKRYKGKLLECDMCGVEFKRKYHLLRHKLKHDPRSWIKCSYCDYRTHRSDVLAKHLKVHHLHEVVASFDHVY